MSPCQKTIHMHWKKNFCGSSKGSISEDKSDKITLFSVLHFECWQCDNGTKAAYLLCWKNSERRILFQVTFLFFPLPTNSREMAQCWKNAPSKPKKHLLPTFNCVCLLGCRYNIAFGACFNPDENTLGWNCFDLKHKKDAIWESVQ